MDGILKETVGIVPLGIMEKVVPLVLKIAVMEIAPVEPMALESVFVNLDGMSTAQNRVRLASPVIWGPIARLVLVY